MIERDRCISSFLEQSGWDNAKRIPLPQDASKRRYLRLIREKQSAILMDAPLQHQDPPCPEHAGEQQRLTLGWNASARLASERIEAFLTIATHLRKIGLSTPEILAYDTNQGLALIEDFGDAVIAREIKAGTDECMLYATAAKTAGYLHSRPAPKYVCFENMSWPIMNMDKLALQVNVDLFIDWAPQLFGTTPADDRLRNKWEKQRDILIHEMLRFPHTLVLRDFHAENIIWLPERHGIARPGLLDFQDAVLTAGEWDMAMLLDDARRHVSNKARQAATQAYLEQTGLNETDFQHRLNITGTLNALRVAGVFARLIVQDAKPRYRQFQKQQLSLLQARLRNPAAQNMKQLAAQILPGLLQEN